MKPFIHQDFMLQNDTAKQLYHEHAASLPIIDYHCHLVPKMIADDHRFNSITELWLGGDHYKWRAMRANGVDEYFITGNASDWEKFQKWAETVPYTMRNPLYHWTHLELSSAFGISETLNGKSARRIYDQCNEKLQDASMTARGLMKRYKVEVVCTTDDPIDSLEHHQAIQKSGFEVMVKPAWRPDKAMAIADVASYKAYLQKLEEVSQIAIHTYTDLMTALRKRHDFFAAQGCTVADHGLTDFPAETCTASEANILFDKLMSNVSLSATEQEKLQFALLVDLARLNAEKGWVQQFHFGPLRNTNTRMFHLLGPDTGFDTIGGITNIKALAVFLDTLNRDGCLAKTILYNINPAETSAIAAMIANFQDGKVPGKLQYGSGWWFNDQKDGMEQQMNALSLQGLLSRFVGMLTDSRSFVSYPRHEYFRRILCNLIGEDVEKGLLPVSEMSRIEQMVEDISYYNAKKYFDFK